MPDQDSQESEDAAHEAAKVPLTVNIIPVGEREQLQDSLLHNPNPLNAPSELNLSSAADEEKALYIPPASRRSRIIYELKHPTWRLWTVLIVAVMLLSAIIIGSTLLVLSHNHGVAAVPTPGKSKTTAASCPIVDLGYSQYQGLNQGSTNAWLGMR